MDLFGAFEQQLREALARLYDPAFEPGALLCSTLASPDHQAVAAALRQAVEALKPAADAPPTARSHRLYEILYYRYLRGLTQEEVAAHLNITARHLRREQQDAIHSLARRLWAQQVAPLPAAPAQAEEADQVSDFRAQVRQELAALQKSAPGAVAEVDSVINGVIQLGDLLVARHDVRLVSATVEPALAATHPTVLRQLLITVIEKLVQQMAGGVIQLSAGVDGADIALTVTATPRRLLHPPDSDLICEILAAQGGSLHTVADDHHLTLVLRLPKAAKIPILVIDDNVDLVHFYHRYVANTRYEIVHAAAGQVAFALAEQRPPRAIVLDVMLPDADGWELLTQLRRHPATTGVPVIVCSVVRRAELANALQAALYVAKPVRRQQFIQALDQVVAPVAPAAQPRPVSSAAIC
jgi:CheY-like chemotaxis protein/transcriptional regulator with XRE-family HTH domain